MSHFDLIGCKKRKRGEPVFKFKNFGENGYPIEFLGSYRENVKALLEFGHFESNLCKGMPCWSFQLEVHRNPPLHMALFVVEEPIDVSSNRHCKHCQYIGWGHHMICNKKYHFILPSKDTIVEACLNCNEEYNGLDSSINGKSNLIELQGHLMHGVFHSNGFGHLLCVNGLEMGSDLAGYQIIEFWDRLCIGLKARKVSLKDISQKRGMDLRLIYGIAYGKPWFGCWGYKFGRGTYCVTQQMYQKAIEALIAMPLCLLIHHFSNSNNEIPLIFTRYQTLSDHSLVTLGGLLHSMLELKSKLPKENCAIDSYSQGIFIEANCRWSPRRVEMATRVIVEALKRAQFKWVSRQEVRDAARVYIGDTGLLDFVLKSLGNHIVGNYLVRRSLNPVTKVLEYCLEDISNVFPNQEGYSQLTNNNTKVIKPRYKITRVQLMKDLFYLYRYILKDQKLTNTGIFAAMPLAIRIVLDSKYLMKEYCNEEQPIKLDQLGLEENLSLYCTIVLRNNAENVDGSLLNRIMPPYECVKVRKNATIDELKAVVERSFRDIYWGLRRFVVESIPKLNGKGMDLVSGLVGLGDQKLVFEGINKEIGPINGDELYERGPNSNFVNCLCGAKDEDGERMISCDICEKWQHTRCVGIGNNAKPSVFLCDRCEQEIIVLSSLP